MAQPITAAAAAAAATTSPTTTTTTTPAHTFHESLGRTHHHGCVSKKWMRWGFCPFQNSGISVGRCNEMKPQASNKQKAGKMRLECFENLCRRWRPWCADFQCYNLPGFTQKIGRLQRDRAKDIDRLMTKVQFGQSCAYLAHGFRI